jgi:hypothetical protein
MPQIVYSDGTTSVELGDQVSARHLLRRRAGRVMYVPGVSNRVGSFEHHGLTWVGIAFPTGTVIGSVVDPETSRLQPNVHFLCRAPPSDVEDSELLARIEAEDPDEPEPPTDTPPAETPPPRLIDWVGGLVSLLLYAAVYVGIITAIFLGLRFVWRLF